jgi:hypothetical protein
MWPGQMGYDPLYAYKEAISGIETMTWPPLHAYLFALSRAFGAGAGGLFAAQTFLLFLAASLSFNLLIDRRPLALAAMAGFALLFAMVPPMLGALMSLWRDVPTATFALVSLALWLLAGRYRSLGLIVASALALGCSVALRYNAFPLFALTAPLMIWRPFHAPRPSGRVRAVTVIALILSIGLAWASTQWRLPDFKRLPAAQSFAGIQLFDLLGISACANHSYLPLGVTNGWPLTGAQVRQIYDPRHLNRAFGKHGDLPEILPTDAHGRVPEIWRDVVPKEFGCYLSHRPSVFVEQMGLAPGAVFIPLQGSIDPNPFGLTLAHPWATSQFNHYVQTASPHVWQRPVLIYVAAGLVVLALLMVRHRYSLLAVALLGGAFANPALLFLIGPAADARYIIPSNVLCALLVAGGLAMLAEPRGPASGERTLT